MSGKMIDKTGLKIGWWTVIRRSSRKNSSGYFWICKCICGREKEISNNSITSKDSNSCGCSRLKKNRRDKFFSRKYVIKENGCWEWIGTIDNKGYPRFGRDQLAHRFSYKKFKGEIPKGLCVCHNCPGGDNPKCVNPEHLWLGTQKENILDKGPKGKQSRGESQGQSKLKESQVKEILTRLKNGELGTELASEFNVSSGLIYHIKKGRAWIHIERPS